MYNNRFGEFQNSYGFFILQTAVWHVESEVSKK